ncbi:MAG: LLM class flavin-dependent oxidoreductase [Nitrososphaerales archaeon]
MSRMKFGLFLPMSGALADIENIVQAGIEAERLGYDCVWVYDMSLTQTKANYLNNLVCGSVEDIDPNGNPNFFEPLTTLGALAVKTSTIRIGSAVLQLPVYNPIAIAKQAANIDALSHGRLNLGIGIGSGISFFRQGFENIHFPFRKRGAIFDEYVTAIRQLWTSKSPSSFGGKYIQFSNLELFPKPTSLRVFIGSGVAEKGLRRVMDFGDGVIFPYRSPAESRANVEKIREEAKKRGRDYREIEIAQTIFTCMEKTYEEARALLYPTIVTHATGFGGKAMSTDELARPAKHTLSAEDLLNMSLLGTRKEIVQQVERFEEAGVNHIISAFIFRGKDKTALFSKMKTFAEEIIPSFR